MLSIWTIKCRVKLQGGYEGWHWNRYFSGEDGSPSKNFGFGGPDWIRSPGSQKFLRESVKRNDLVVCYQTDDRSIHGLARMASSGKESKKGSGIFDLFYLIPCNHSIELIDPISIDQLREHGCDPKCFQMGTQGTVFPMENREFEELIRVLCAIRPKDSHQIVAWLKESGINWRGDTTPRDRAESSRQVGAGFSTTVENNERVERAAIDFVAAHFQKNGWKVESVESRGCGYDLLCRRKGEEAHLEVKGVSGSDPTFIVTSGEVSRAESDEAFIIVVVTSVLTKPYAHFWTGSQFVREFKLSPIQFMARRISV